MVIWARNPQPEVVPDQSPGKAAVSGNPAGIWAPLSALQRLELLGTIHVRGCIHAVGLWLKDNFQATLAIVCSLLLPQVRAGSPGILSPIPGILSWEDPPRIRDEPPVLGFSAPSRLAGSEGSAPFPVLEGGK